MRYSFALLIVLLLSTSACSGCFGCDTETKPGSQTEAVQEAEATLDRLSGTLLPDVAYETSSWTPTTGCETAATAPEQGDIGKVEIRSYTEAALSGAARTQDGLIEDFKHFWEAEDVAVSPSGAASPSGAVARVNGIGYDIVALDSTTQLRAFVPCY